MDTWIDRDRGRACITGYAQVAGCADALAAHGLPPLLAAVFEQLPYGMMIVTLEGQVLHANKMAIHALDSYDIWIDAGLRLVTLRPSDVAKLRRALAAAAVLRRSLVELGAGSRKLAVGIQALRIPNSTQVAPCAVLLFGRSAYCDALALGAFGRSRGLTPAELVVLDALGEGLRAKEVALRLKSSIATVRSHLRNIYQKTGSRDLHELMAQLAALPPLGPVLR